MLKKNDIIKTDHRTYRIMELLGVGANTISYLAECSTNTFTNKCILKEFAPQNKENYEYKKNRFCQSAETQNQIRQMAMLHNQTPPVSHIFHTEDTVYIDVVCFGGKTLKQAENLSLLQYIMLCRTIANTVKYYHECGYLCLDLKPENIFILQNTSQDTITQIVEFIDFDSICKIADIQKAVSFSYTREWSAPEQLNPYALRRIGCYTDIYTLGELVFYYLFGRHSTETEHRGFSRYPFQDVKKEYRNYMLRPDIRSLLQQIFRKTIRSSAINRFQNTDELIDLLDQLIQELQRKDYIIPIQPAVSPDFIGRTKELKKIRSCLDHNNILYISGIGGIGKSTLIKNFIVQNNTEYDAIIYLEYDTNIVHTFCDDEQLQISTIHREENESELTYFNRKLSMLKSICRDKRTLFVVDNFSDKITKPFQKMIDCGFDTIIVSRNPPPKNSFPYLEITAFQDRTDFYQLIQLNLGRMIAPEERESFDEIIDLIQGHTLVLELIARQISVENFSLATAIELIRKRGFFHFSNEKISNLKDGIEYYDALSIIISDLFSASNLSDAEEYLLKIISLLHVRGLETELIQKFFPEMQNSVLNQLCTQGWIYTGDRTHMHPVISETIRNWKWNTDDVRTMETYKKIIAIYEGKSDAVHILAITREAERYKESHPRHIISAMYYDMIGSYYDTLIDGKYVPYTKQEEEQVNLLIESMKRAIEEMELSSDPRKEKYLIQYYQSMASILLRSTPNYHLESLEYLDMAWKRMKNQQTIVSENLCTQFMVSAWYYTLAKPDLDQTILLTQSAEQIAKQVYQTELEIIDVVYIPTANCFFYHNALSLAEQKIKEAIAICEKYTDSISYIDKSADLMRCLIDIYLEQGNMEQCRILLCRLDEINQKYQDEGVCRWMEPEKRNLILSS